MGRKRGIGVVETLLGLSLMTMAMFALVQVYGQFKKSQANASKTTAAEAIVTAIIASLTRESGFVDPDGTLNQYNESTLQNFQLNYFGTVLAEKRDGFWVPQFFNSDGAACNPDVLDPDCNIRVDFNLIADLSIASAPRWRANYNVSIVDNPRSPSPVSLASNPSTISISRKFTSLAIDKTSCEFGEVTFRGFDLNGDVVCWQEAPASESCTDDQFVSGYYFDGASNQVLPVCQNLRGIGCGDDHFALEAVNPKFVDSRLAWNGAQAGDCRFVTKDRAPAGVPSDPSHPQQCPKPNYVLNGAECELDPSLINPRPAVAL